MVKVNDTDYDGRIVIELEHFCVPAWDELGYPDLVGDKPEYIEHNGKQYIIGYSWSSRDAAEKALKKAFP